MKNVLLTVEQQRGIKALIVPCLMKVQRGAFSKVRLAVCCGWVGGWEGLSPCRVDEAWKRGRPLEGAFAKRRMCEERKGEGKKSKFLDDDRRFHCTWSVVSRRDGWDVAALGRGRCVQGRSCDATVAPAQHADNKVQQGGVGRIQPGNAKPGANPPPECF